MSVDTGCSALGGAVLVSVLRSAALIPRRAAALAIRGYQVAISPLLPSSCRFTPTCSAYALTSVERYGLLQGGWMALRRVARCHPFHPGGHDPVP